MAIERQWADAASGLTADGAYWRICGWQITRAAQSDADRAAIVSLLAFTSREQSQTPGAAPIPGSEMVLAFVRQHAANTESGNVECVLVDQSAGQRYALDVGEMGDPNDMDIALWYTLIRQTIPSFRGAAATDVLEE